MNQPPSVDPEQASAEHAEETSLSLAAEYWPQMLAGTLIAMALLSIRPTAMTPFLVWLPPALLIGWFAVGMLFRAKPKEKTPEPWEIAIPLAPSVKAALAAQGEAVPPKAAPAAQPMEPAPTAQAPEKAETPPPAAPAKKAAPAVSTDGADVVILWGSETGNAEGLASMAEAKLGESGLKARSISMADMNLAGLQGCRQVLIITSTWGDGDPPSNAIDLWEALQKETADLSGTRFSVLSLGDTAYPQFCKCGKDFDAFLEAQGAQRIHPRVDCDLDYEQPFEQWLAGVGKAVQAQLAGV